MHYLTCFSLICNTHTHTHTYTEMRCVCVDPKEGVFMVRRTCSGIDIPIHVLKRTGSSRDHSACELSACLETSRAAARGNQPGYECEHLRSVQHAQPFIPQQPLDSCVLERMASELRWLKESRRRETHILHEEATAKGICPVYPWLPEKGQSQRYTHYSVVSGTAEKHYWCRLGRVVVSFDIVKGVWKCACSPSRRPCVHKALAKWYALQHFPEMLKSLPTNEESTDEEDIDVLDGKEVHTETTATPGCLHVYPPSGQLLERMMSYLRTKPIPVELPQQLLSEAGLMSIECVTPIETHCELCPSHPPLNVPLLITSSGTLVTLQGVKRGMCNVS